MLLPNCLSLTLFILDYNYYCALLRFCEEDIDQILERRTQVIQIESQGKGSTFAKVIPQGLITGDTKNSNHSDVASLLNLAPSLANQI